jgi:hypothetical protein
MLQLTPRQALSLHRNGRGFLFSPSEERYTMPVSRQPYFSAKDYAAKVNDLH